jgi:hypothetical protein
MSRYKDIPQLKNNAGERVTRSVLLPNIGFSAEDVYVRTQPGDRLDLLSYQFYGTVDYWWIIAHANSIGKGSLSLEEGTVVRIPANPASIALQLKEVNR